MRIKQGKIYAVVEKNGCGKTTLMNQIFLQHHHQKIVYIQQNNFLIEQYTIEKNLQFFGYNFQNQQINRLLELQEIGQLYPSQVSLGQRQMAVIVGALYSESEVIIFDETLSGLNHDILNFLFPLCQKISLQENKTILIVTHQKEIIDQCDEVIDIENQDIKLELDFLLPKKHSKISWKDIWVYQNKNRIKQILIFVMMSICLLFIFFTQYYREMTYADMNNQLAKNMSQEVFVMNNTDVYHPYYQQYDIYYQSLTNQQIQDLKKIEGLSDFQPYIPFCLKQKRNQNHEVYYDSVVVMDGKQEVEKTLSNDKQYFINGYTSFSKMDDSLEYRTSHQQGLILSKWFLEELDMSYHDLENMQLKINIAIPIQQSDTIDGMQTAILDENDEVIWKDIEGREIEYQEMTMTFDIKGVLDENGLFISRDYCFAYLDQTTMLSLFEQYNINYQPNAYFAKIDHLEKYQSIQSQVEKVASTLEFYCAYSLNQIADTVLQFVKILSLICIIPLGLLMIVLVYTIFGQKRLRLQEYDKLMHYQLSFNQTLVWIIKKYLLEILIFFWFYGVLYVCVNLFLYTIHYPLLLFWWGMIILPILLLYVLPVGVDIYALYRKYEHHVG